MAVALAALVVVVAAGGAAGAHTGLVEAQPADGATVDRMPSSVQLGFSQQLGAGLATVVVTGPAGAAVSSGPAVVDGTRVVQQLGSLPAPGRYTVAYRVVSADGHPISGQTSFTVTAVTGGPPSTATPALSAVPSGAPSQPAAPPTGSPGTATDGADGGGGGMPVAAAAVGALAAATAVGIAVRRRRGRSDDDG